jgi:beta-phosphoglucomutase
MKAVIFDLDGTIINTENMWADATKQMLISRGITYVPETRMLIHDAVHGLPPLKACAIVKEMFGLSDSVENLAQEKSQRARTLFQGNIRLIEGFADFYKHIASKGFKTAIATNCDASFVALADQEVKLSSYFQHHMYGIDQVAYRCKPDPAIYLFAAQQIGIKPIECIAIEDSAAGITASKRAGMFCIGINTANNRANIKHADVIVETYGEIELDKLM